MSGASSVPIDANHVLCILPDAQWTLLATDWRSRAPAIHFEHVDSGEVGLTRLGELRPALVIVGMSVEDMEGLEFLACAMSRYKDFLGKIIVYPGEGDPFSPVAHYRDTASGRSVTEELEPGALGDMIAALAPTPPPEPIAKPAAAPAPIAKPAEPAGKPAAATPAAARGSSASVASSKTAAAPAVPATAARTAPTTAAIRPSPIRALALGIPAKAAPPPVPPKIEPVRVPPPQPAAPVPAARETAPTAPAHDVAPPAFQLATPAVEAARAEPSPIVADAPIEPPPRPVSTVPESERNLPYAAALDARFSSSPAVSAGAAVRPRARRPQLVLFGAAGAVVLAVLALGARHCMSSPTAAAVTASARVTPRAPNPTLTEGGARGLASAARPSAAQAATPAATAEPPSIDVRSMTTLPLSFDRGRADFTVDDATGLEAIVGEFSRALSVHANARVEVGGHTSAEGAAGVNQALGRERALLARRYLAEHSIPESRTMIVNYAATRPATAGNDMEANRRVTLRIVE